MMLKVRVIWTCIRGVILAAACSSILACSSGSEASKGAKQGATTGAVAGAVGGEGFRNAGTAFDWIYNFVYIVINFYV